MTKMGAALKVYFIEPQAFLKPSQLIRSMAALKIPFPYTGTHLLLEWVTDLTDASFLKGGGGTKTCI